MPVAEKLGQFYLGREHSLESGETSSVEVQYDARDLTTHAVCVGMTGSGKTGLCLSLLEEAAIDGVPAICIDPKGDLGNLMLAFPELTPNEFRPWVDQAEALRHGQSVDEYARSTAKLWKTGLAKWGQGPERIRRFQQSADVNIYTPASDAGRPLTVLRSFAAPDPSAVNDSEAFRERIMAAVSGLLALLQIDADPIASREHILLSTILDHEWRRGADIDMGTLIRLIQTPPFDQVGFLSLDSFYPSEDRFKLSMSLNNLLASPSFAGWMEGEPLSIPGLLYTPEGKPQLAIVSIAHLSDEERMFFVTILLNELISWMRQQPGTSSLRAVLYMDEIFGYFPPTANPPSKQPMLTLLKQARAYGVGCVLATQNPVDLDYKGLSNTGTWFIGRLQTERDKLRVMEGLEGAAASTGGTFHRQEMEQTLAALGDRVFLMHNVHEDEPVIFRTRWALSYLRGPLSRQQIEVLMADRRAPDGGQAVSRAAAGSAEEKDDRPVLPPDIREVFLKPQLPADAVVWVPALYGQVRIHYVLSRSDVDHWVDEAYLVAADENLTADVWDRSEEWNHEIPPPSTDPSESGSRFVAPDADVLSARSWPRWKSSLKTWVYRERRLSLWTCPALKETSRPEESEADFRIRIRHAAREQRDLQIEKIRARYASRLRTIRDRIRRAEQKVEREKSQKSQKTMSAGLSVLTSIAGALFGRKLGSVANVSRASTAIRSAGSARKEAEDVRHAEESLRALVHQQEELNAEIEEEVVLIRDRFDPDLIELETQEIKPRKSDIAIEDCLLLWLPHHNRSGSMEPLY